MLLQNFLYISKVEILDLKANLHFLDIFLNMNY
jgi:hypothetical protein